MKNDADLLLSIRQDKMSRVKNLSRYDAKDTKR